MKEILVNKTKVLTVPAGADHLIITHEWGDTVIPSTAVSGTYSFTPDSVGVHKFVWKSGSTVVSTEFYSVAQQLITDVDFFEAFSNLEVSPNDDNFAATERKIRHIIQSYTGQQFGPYIAKTLDVAGDGGDSLELPYRISQLSAITDNWGEDLSTLVQICPGSEWFIEYINSFAIYRDIKRDLTREPGNFFASYRSFSITGDYGWPYVPTEVTDAATLLIADDFTGSGDLRHHGINEAQLGDFSYKLNADQWGTTGNTQADLLLAPYVVLRIGLV